MSDNQILCHQRSRPLWRMRGLVYESGPMWRSRPEATHTASPSRIYSRIPPGLSLGVMTRTLRRQAAGLVDETDASCSVYDGAQRENTKRITSSSSDAGSSAMRLHLIKVVNVCRRANGLPSRLSELRWRAPRSFLSSGGIGMIIVRRMSVMMDKQGRISIHSFWRSAVFECDPMPLMW
ncbi:hypothetical protein JAAARDRAFT_260675 [Jaapia argillacea MUCL 33604]|uniref:Uncharacterized protein n=1 Tax=Jaapia argillacea MUCL 33604 TaxID=933084 RepID=A0A067PTS2_9AGAM|nr:hypothetical protein JAAARDRAFT_260675 [Jaapia argillacea MUCL 33604]